MLVDENGGFVHQIPGESNDPGNTDWASAAGEFVATGTEKSIVFFLEGGISNGGDALFDHAYLVTDDDYKSCTQHLDFIFRKYQINYKIIINCQIYIYINYIIRYNSPCSLRVSVAELYKYLVDLYPVLPI